MMRLFHSPGACSEGILLLLEEIGAPFAVEIVDLKSGQQRAPAFLEQNPKGKVPALLRPDGSLLSEFPAIALWLGRSFPGAGLLGDGTEAEVRALEMTEFIVASLHMRGFTLLKVPQKFAADPGAQATIAAHGREQVEAGLAYLSDCLGSQDYLLGQFSIADAAAFYVLNWAQAENIELSENLNRLHARIVSRRSNSERRLGKA